MEYLNHILLVDDSTNDVELTLIAFKENKLANKIDVARDGMEALDYLHKRGAFTEREGGNPILILLDIKMPKISGLEVLKIIREEEPLHLIPVVLLTSSREDIDIIKGYERGCNGYVVKPVDFPAFMEAVKQIGAFWAVLNEPPPIHGLGPQTT